jgi:hypothetical protein
MARATHTRSTDAPQDAIALLKQDHRTVEALFDEFEDADESEQSALATRKSRKNFSTHRPRRRSARKMTRWCTKPRSSTARPRN